MTLPSPEDVTSQSLVDNISNNKWIKARGALIREYAIRETALKAANEVETLLTTECEAARTMGDRDPFPPVVTILETWIRVTRETNITEIPGD